MKFEKLITDTTETDQPEGSYRFAKNLVDSTTLGSLENELGFLNKNWGYTYPFLGVAAHTVIGIIPIDVGFVVFSTDEINSEIGLYNSTANTYTIIYNDGGNALNFRRTAPIKGEYRVEATGNRIITWIDDNNVPRLLNIDNLSLVNTVNDLNIFQNVLDPYMSAYSISDFGGSLTVGAYVLFTYYRGNDGSITNFYVHDKVFYINDDPKTTSFQNDDGAPGGTSSNKAINVTFSGCDTNFDNIVVGFIRTASQITTAFTAVTKAVSATTNVTITGAEGLTSVSLDQLLTANASYSNAKAITQVNNQLLLANLTSAALPDFQAIALDINVNYTLSLVNVISNTGTHKDVLPPTLMPGEVYALYIGFELLKGGWVYYHIPGRAPVAGETDAISNDGLSYKRYQVNNTSNAGGASNNLGYWENVSETYPNNAIYGALQGQLIRHHRMPTLNYLNNTFYSGNPDVGTTTLPVLGLAVANVNIPAGIQAQIQRWKIFYAKKSPSNSIMGGSDLLHHSISPPSSAGVYWTTGGNWQIDAPHSGWESMTSIHRDSHLGHSLDALYTPAEFTPDFMYLNYYMRAGGDATLTNAIVNKPWNGFRGGGGLLTMTGSNRGTAASFVVDYTESGTTKQGVSSSNVLRKVQSYQYIPQNSKLGTFKSAYAEGFFASIITPPATPIDIVAALQTKGSGDVAPSPVQMNKSEQSCYLQYGKIVSNAHTSFTAQDLVPMEGQGLPYETGSGGPGTVYFSGGDTFLCYMSHFTAGPLNGNQTTTLGDPNTQGVRVWKAYVGYSRRNWNYRHQIAGNPSTYYYGKTDPTTLFSPALRTPVDVAGTGSTGSLLSVTEGFNQVTYNPDFNKMNEFTVGTIYSVDLLNATKFPNLIIYSNVQGSESKDISWRLFPAGNRYTMPKNKGAIINLQGLANIDLLIHHEYSLYKTRTNAGIEADGTNIFLKSNELFTLQPMELLSTTTGYCGTQNKFSCVLTKAGYSFVDDLQGKVFLYSGEQPEEISSYGMRKFFRDNMGVKQDNPFFANGYTMGYDEYSNRLILAKKQSSTSWTISYNPSKKTWTSFHDYTPDYMFSTIENRLWSINSNSLFLHNAGARGVYYNPVVINPSCIDVVHNPESTKDKIFMEANWLTESYDATGALSFMDTITAITFRSLDHCSGRILTSRFTDIDLLYTNNIRNLNRTWYFNDIRDIALQTGFTLGFYQNYALDATKLNTNMEWYDQRKFVDKFVICRLEYANTTGNRFLLLESDIEFRYAPK